MAKATDYFGSSEDLKKALTIPDAGATPCDSAKMPKVDINADAPINVANIGNAEATLSFKSAKTIAVTASSVSVVSMPNLAMYNAINALPHSNSYFYEVVDGRSYVLLNAYAIEGLKIAYTLTTGLTATAKASIKATPNVSVGTEASPVKASVDVSDDGTQVVISIPTMHYVLGQMVPIGELTRKQVEDPNSKAEIGIKTRFPSCKSAGMC